MRSVHFTAADLVIWPNTRLQDCMKNAQLLLTVLLEK